jgi:hypothetical protein
MVWPCAYCFFGQYPYATKECFFVRLLWNTMTVREDAFVCGHIGAVSPIQTNLVALRRWVV